MTFLQQDAVRRRRPDGFVETIHEEMLQERRFLKFKTTGAFTRRIKSYLSTPKMQRLVLDADREDEPSVQLEAIKTIKLLTSAQQKEPIINAAIACDIFPILIRCLKRNDNTELQLETTLLLTNMATGTHSQLHQMFRTRIIPAVVELLRSPHQEIREQAVVTVLNIMADGPYLRNYTVQFGVVNLFFKFMDSNISIEFMRTINQALLNICRYEGPPTLPIDAILLILPKLCSLLDHSDTTILLQTLWSISFLVNVSIDHIQLIIDHFGLVLKVIIHLSHAELKIKAIALRIIGTITTGTETQSEILIKYDIMSYIAVFLSYPDKNMCKETMWLLSNIIVGPSFRLKAAIDANILPHVVHHLSNSELEIQQEATWVITNFTRVASRKELDQLIETDVLEPFCKMLLCNQAEIIVTTLCGIHNMFRTAGENFNIVAELIDKECGGHKHISDLVNHANKEVSDMAQKIINRFFLQVSVYDAKYGSEVEDENLSPDGGGDFYNQFANLRL